MLCIPLVRSRTVALATREPVAMSPDFGLAPPAELYYLGVIGARDVESLNFLHRLRENTRASVSSVDSDAS